MHEARQTIVLDHMFHNVCDQFALLICQEICTDSLLSEQTEETSNLKLCKMSLLLDKAPQILVYARQEL